MICGLMCLADDAAAAGSRGDMGGKKRDLVWCASLSGVVAAAAAEGRKLMQMGKEKGI